jgi:hypothetical protein
VLDQGRIILLTPTKSQHTKTPTIPTTTPTAAMMRRMAANQQRTPPTTNSKHLHSQVGQIWEFNFYSLFINQPIFPNFSSALHHQHP